MITHKDIIIITNYQKVTDALRILLECICGDEFELDKTQYKIVKKELLNMQARLLRNWPEQKEE